MMQGELGPDGIVGEPLDRTPNNSRGGVYLKGFDPDGILGEPLGKTLNTP